MLKTTRVRTELTSTRFGHECYFCSRLDRIPYHLVFSIPFKFEWPLYYLVQMKLNCRAIFQAVRDLRLPNPDAIKVHRVCRYVDCLLE